MKTFIGVKIVQAEPLTLGAYNERRGWQIPADEDPAKPGYFLQYPDGYVSWSPAAIFEGTYREISPAERTLCVAPPKKETFLSRLIAEHNDLEDRLGKLTAFIDDVDGKGAFELLPHAQRQLLSIQHVHMTQYLGTLGERLVILGAKPEPAADLYGDLSDAPAAQEMHDQTTSSDLHDAGDRDEIIEARVTGGGANETPIPFQEN